MSSLIGPFVSDWSAGLPYLGRLAEIETATASVSIAPAIALAMFVSLPSLELVVDFWRCLSATWCLLKWICQLMYDHEAVLSHLFRRAAAALGVGMYFSEE